MNDHRRIRPLLAALLAVLLLAGCGAAASAQPTPETAPTPAAAEQTPEASAAPAEPEETVVEVSTVDELLAAIAPHTTIVLTNGVFDLTTASDYGGVSRSDYYDWIDLMVGDDGSTECELVIRDVEGLTIRGAGMGYTDLCTRPRYANVLRFYNCRELTLADLTVGHTVEPGACSGGVLYLENCERTAVERCGLYGCGAVAVWGYDCAGLYVGDSELYDCSVSAADLRDCRDVLVQNCLVHDNGKNGGDFTAFSLFNFYGCEDVTVIGCAVRDNEAQNLLWNEYSKRVRFVSDTVMKNRFENVVFAILHYAPAVDGCAFADNECPAGWFDEKGLPVLDLAGGVLDGAALEAMRYREIGLDELPAASDAPEQLPAGGEVRVASVDEFLAALGSDRTIILAEGEYDLSTASDYGGAGGVYYTWRPVYDGWELLIRGVSALTIRAEGEDAADTVLQAVPRYANVLAFVECERLSLSGFTAGHTVEPGFCSGGVVNLADCHDVSLDACRLYGCGTLGVYAWRCTGFRADECEIYDCSYGGVEMNECDGIAFSDCDIHDVPSPALSFWSCGDRTWNGGPIVYPSCDVDENGALVDAGS